MPEEKRQKYKDDFNQIADEYKQLREQATKKDVDLFGKPLFKTRFGKGERDQSESQIPDLVSRFIGLVDRMESAISSSHESLQHIKETVKSSIKDLPETEQEYIDRMKDGSRKENFIKRLKAAKEGHERFQQVVDAAPPDIKYILLSKCGEEIRVVLAKLKPLSMGGVRLDLRAILLPQYDSTTSRKEWQMLIEHAASLDRKVGQYLVAQLPDLHMIDPSPEDFYELPSGNLQPTLGCIYYSLDSTQSLFQEYPNIFGNSHSASSIESAIHGITVSEFECPKEDKEDLLLKKGLFCGIPYEATKQCSKEGYAVLKEKAELIGLSFGCKSLEEKTIKEFIQDYKAILKYSGISDTYEPLSYEDAILYIPRENIERT